MSHPEIGPITTREFDQLSQRVSDNAARLTKLEDERVTLAVLSTQLGDIRTDFASHETAHANRDANLRADLRSMLVKVGSAVALALLGEIAQLLHTYLHF